ncbi:30S ribosomal protein S20 [Candidatus Margulisiibacteriota bacterium]
MANTKSSKQRILTNIRDNQKNVSVRSKIKTHLKKVDEAIKLKDENLKSVISQTVKVIDTAASRGVIKKTTASRKKSRLMKRAAKESA